MIHPFLQLKNVIKKKKDSVFAGAAKCLLKMKKKTTKSNDDVHEEKDGNPAAQKKAKGSDSLEELFADAPPEWAAALLPILRSSPNANDFLGGHKDVVPVRGLIFQALKPLAPSEWKVVVFGQNPYPRPESATGIAMLDATFDSWDDKRFGSVVSMRNIIKAAFVDKFGINKKTDVGELRKLLKAKKIVGPQEFFSCLLSQGVLLLNASLTTSTGEGKLTQAQHSNFWKPVVEKIVDEIVRSKKSKGSKGIVFAWWGDKASKLKKMAEDVCSKYPSVRVEHVHHANPAAQGDKFSVDGNVFGAINDALERVGESRVDFLPISGSMGAKHIKMAQFVEKTMEMHKSFLDRLADTAGEKHLEKLEPIAVTVSKKKFSLKEAVADLELIVPDAITGVEEFLELDPDGEEKNNVLSQDHRGALMLYTQSGNFYRILNEALRTAKVSEVKPFFPYLHLLLHAMETLGQNKKYACPKLLYRGVGLDMRSQYKTGNKVVWWGLSSTTRDEDVAESFLGCTGQRTLFKLSCWSAVAISEFSALPDEDEFLLFPGTTLEVTKVVHKEDGLTTIHLKETKDARLIKF